MTIYLGTEGGIELQRESGAIVEFTIDPDDVNVPKRRFSFDEDDLTAAQLISGDSVDIKLVTSDLMGDDTNLELIAGHNYPDWRGFISVDQLGGIRLYETFEAAVTGEEETALDLVVPSGRQQIYVQTRARRFGCIAQVKQYEFTTERDTIDVTTLPDQYKKQYEAGLISGQGNMQCFWEHQLGLCDGDVIDDPSEIPEFPAYLSQLCIRLVQGADFYGRFFIYRSPNREVNSVWYEAECIVTNATVSVVAGEVIESNVQFVTTGPVRLRNGVPPVYLLKENGIDYVLTEDGQPILITD